MKKKYEEEYLRLLEECNRLHPDYSSDEMEKWATYSAKSHVDRRRGMKYKLSASVEQRLWRVLILLFLILFTIHTHC